MKLYHPELGQTIDVSEGSAHVYRRSGWIDADGSDVDSHADATAGSTAAASGAADGASSDGPTEGREREEF